MKKILIIHPEGNINNNPNLTGIVEILCENGFRVHVLSPRVHGVYQQAPCPGSNLDLVANSDMAMFEGLVLFAGKKGEEVEKAIAYIKTSYSDFQLVIGIDRGIIEADLIARILKIPCGLISYEILFEDETSAQFKKPEIEACQSISFAVCQDPERAELLSIQNRIDSSKMFHIPVAGRTVKPAPRTRYLHQQLNINPNKKIALLVGSVSEMSRIDFLAESAKHWPNDWVLVFHNRYGINQRIQSYVEKYSCIDNIYFSDKPVQNPNDMHKILHSASIGLAFYQSFPNSIWLGKNIKHLGLASGKISTYMQHGIPVITNDIGIMSDFITKAGLGRVVDIDRRFSIDFDEKKLRTWQQNCLAFFQEKLDLNRTIIPLLKKIECLTERIQKLDSGFQVEKNHAGNRLPDGFRLIQSTESNHNFDQLRYRRSRIANECLNASIGDLQQLLREEYMEVLKEVLRCGLKAVPLEKDEQKLVDLLLVKLQRNNTRPDKCALYMVAMLYIHAYQLPGLPEIEKLPDWFREEFWRMLTLNCLFFQEPGDVEKYGRYIMAITDLLYGKLEGSTLSGFWRRAAMIYAEVFSFVPLYFSKQNLATLYKQRAAIILAVLPELGFQPGTGSVRTAPNRRKIRLGVYASCIDHSTEMFASIPVFGYLDRERFEVTLYVHKIVDNSLAQKLKNLVQRIEVLPENLNDCAARIRNDDLDILFFCNNLTANTSRAHILAQHRLARRQCVHFRQPLSTGITCMDHFLLGEDIQRLTAQEETFSEQMIDLAGSGICFDLPPDLPSSRLPLARNMLNLDESQTVYISGANYFKIVPELQIIWAKILAKVPGAVLILFPFGPAWSSRYPKKPFVLELRKVFKGHGLQPEQLIVFDMLPDRGAILDLMNIADIYLDAVPYSGATSLLDPLQVGLPPVTVQGRQLRFCQGAAMLSELGLAELVAGSDSEYRRLAIDLAMKPAWRNTLRNRIHDGMSRRPPFLDPERYGRQMTQIFMQLVHRPQMSENPVSMAGIG